MSQLDDLVNRYLDLTDQITRLTEARDQVKAQLRDLGPGDHVADNGVKVTVSPPSRRFNLDRAWTMLTPEQQAACTGPDAGKVKKQLPPVLLDQCMDEGKGEQAVRVTT